MKYILFTLLFALTYVIFNTINYYQIKNIEPTIWNLTKYNFFMLPVYLFVNVLLTITFSKAYASIEKIWPVTVIYWGAGVIVTAATAFIFFKEVPKSNVLVGAVLTVAGIIVANIK